jgi:hypothetical protein
MLLEALAVTVTVPDTVAPEAGDVIDTVGGGVLFALFTVTVIVALIPVWPALSWAAARSVCDPLLALVLSQEYEYGAVVTTLPTLAPSNSN